MRKDKKSLVSINKNNTSLVNVENNNDTEVNINIGVTDELSYDNIKRNYDKLSMIEDEFNDRLEFSSKNVFTKRLLPKQLQDDFSIVPKIYNGKLRFETIPITPDAYEKFPKKTTINLEFNDIEEARKFRENGIDELQKKADLMQQPVEIPNITNIKDFIGIYENPTSRANKYGSDGIKLFICPKPIPPAKKYEIEIFNSKMSFKLITSLRLLKYEDKELVFNNDESDNEYFNVLIKLSLITKENDDIPFQGNFSLTISLKKEYVNSCDFNKELLKYKFLIEDKNNHIRINNINENINIFSFNNCGTKKYNMKDYKEINDIINLIDKVIYILKVKDIEFDFDLEYFFKNKAQIDILYKNILMKKNKINKEMSFNYRIPKNEETDKFIKNPSSLFVIVSKLEQVDLFNQKIKLNNNRLELLDCTLTNVIENEDSYDIKVETNNITIIPVHS